MHLVSQLSPYAPVNAAAPAVVARISGGLVNPQTRLARRIDAPIHPLR